MFRKTCFIIALASAAIAAAPAQAVTIADPANDFLPSFIGPNDADLDVTSFSVDYNATTMTFSLGATFAGDINPSRAGFYVIGVNTGTGVLAPFGPIGNPNVIFNQAIVLRKDGTGNIGQTALDPASIIIVGNILTARVPLALLPSTGFGPLNYGFNLWPRNGSGELNQISDFAPDNANLSIAAVPEPATWATLVLGVGAAGGAVRLRVRRRAAAA